MKNQRFSMYIGLVLMGQSTLAMAGIAAPSPGDDIELPNAIGLNDVFDDRQILDPRMRHFNANLGAGDFIFSDFIDDEPPPGFDDDFPEEFDIDFFPETELVRINPFFSEGGGPDGFGANDVDFFTFQGLTPGDLFLVRTDGPVFDEGSGVRGLDTMIGLFDDQGVLQAANDDSFFLDEGGSLFSLIGGIVPESGNVNVAVTGFPDFGFTGAHQEEGDYIAEIATAVLGGALEEGDFGFFDVFFDVFTDIVVLPDNDPSEDGFFLFDSLPVVDGQIVNLDPPVAVGYDYEIIGGAGLFDTVVLPALFGDTEFLITFNGTTSNVSAGDVIDLGGVLEFRVDGIDIAAGLDPNNPTAFVTQVAFIGTDPFDPLTVTQTPIVENADVPEPTMLTLLGIGLIGLGFSGLRRRRA
jgi:hypothetical protein